MQASLPCKLTLFRGDRVRSSSSSAVALGRVAAWLTPETYEAHRLAVKEGWAAKSQLPATPAQTAQGTAQSAASAARVEAGREGLEAHVMLEATCSAQGKCNVKAAHAAHLQQGGGMSP